jgi:S1-C subfamily serine protease
LNCKLRVYAIALLIAQLFFANSAVSSKQVETWEKLDKRLKQQIFQVNVGLKMKVKPGLWAQLTDTSPRYHYPVFTTSKDDPGYRVVGKGSTFPVLTRSTGGKETYFITNNHVVEDGLSIGKECELFFSATRLYAEQTSGGKDVDSRYAELLQTINLATKKDMNMAERTLYQSTVDGIWDTYDTYLSATADPGRLLFQKFAGLAGVERQVSYFLHAPGPVSQNALEAKIYKAAKGASDPDIAILTAPTAIPGMEFDLIEPTEGQEVQVIGYPTASEQIDSVDGEASKYYAPTFNSGRVSRVTPHILQVDAPITSGNSGGPVVTLRGKVVGVVAVRAVSARGGELPNFGGAVTVQSVKSFAPELF